MQENKETSEAGGGLVVAIALNGGSKSMPIIKWAIQKFVVEGFDVSFKLLHVFSRINGVPTPMGNLIHVSQVRDDIVSAYKKEIEWQKTEMLLRYQKFCSSNKVSADVVLVEADDIPRAISLEIAKIEAKALVIGNSSNSLFSRKVKGQLLSALISDCAPGFCSVYVVSKGKLESLRPSESEEANWNPSDDITSASGDSRFSSSRYSSSTLDPGSSTSDSTFNSPLCSMRKMEPFSIRKAPFNQTRQVSTDVSNWRSLNQRGGEDALPYFCCNSMVEGSIISRASSSRSYTSEAYSSNSEIPSASSSPSHHNSSQILSSINREIERLTIEISHVRGMLIMAQNETTDSSEMLSDLNKLRLEEVKKLKDMNEKAKELAKLVKEKAESAPKEAPYTKQFALKEMYKRRERDSISLCAAEEKEKYENSSAANNASMSPPRHFICPILKKVMEDPCVAADGYTYERKAIEMWLKENDTSPTTNFSLKNKNLIPSYTLHYAIMDWKAKTTKPQSKSIGNSLRSI